MGLSLPLTLTDVWLRVEHQSFVALPKARSVLFGIRVSVHALADVAHDRVAARGLSRALQTKPEDVTRYNGLAGARAALVEMLT